MLYNLKLIYWYICKIICVLNWKFVIYSKIVKKYLNLIFLYFFFFIVVKLEVVYW